MTKRQRRIALLAHRYELLNAKEDRLHVRISKVLDELKELQQEEFDEQYPFKPQVLMNPDYNA